jgi:hypothetical protein
MDMNVARILVSFGLAITFVALTPPVKADEWNQKTIFTFNNPVEIPGQVLSPGTYEFKLADSLSDRNIVMVYSKNEKHFYGFFLAIPDYRLTPSSKPIITFEERAAGAPEAVKAWFYPGENYGHDFVYPKVKAMELAKANNRPVPSMSNELKSNPTKESLKSAPLTAQQPSQQEVEITKAFPPSRQPSAPPPAPAPAPNELPKTATMLPLIGLIGLGSLLTAAALQLVWTRTR